MRKSDCEHILIFTTTTTALNSTSGGSRIKRIHPPVPSHQLGLPRLLFSAIIKPPHQTYHGLHTLSRSLRRRLQAFHGPGPCLCLFLHFVHFNFHQAVIGLTCCNCCSLSLRQMPSMPSREDCTSIQFTCRRHSKHVV